MSQRLCDHIQKTLVQIGVLAAHDQFHFLAALFGYVSHHPRKTAKELLHWYHANFHYRALQIAQHPRLKSHSITEPAAQGLLRNMPGEFRECLLQHRSADNQFPNQVQHVVDAFGIHAQNVFRVRWPVIGFGEVPMLLRRFLWHRAGGLGGGRSCVVRQFPGRDLLVLGNCSFYKFYADARGHGWNAAFSD